MVLPKMLLVLGWKVPDLHLLLVEKRKVHLSKRRCRLISLAELGMVHFSKEPLNNANNTMIAYCRRFCYNTRNNACTAMTS